MRLLVPVRGEGAPFHDFLNRRSFLRLQNGIVCGGLSKGRAFYKCYTPGKNSAWIRGFVSYDKTLQPF